MLGLTESSVFDMTNCRTTVMFTKSDQFGVELLKNDSETGTVTVGLQLMRHIDWPAIIWMTAIIIVIFTGRFI